MRIPHGILTLILFCACSGKVLDMGTNEGGGSPGRGTGGGSSVGGQNIPGGGGYGDGGTGNGLAGGDNGFGGASNELGGQSAVPFGGAGGGTGGTGFPPWPTDDNCKSGTQLPIVGNWNGYIENYEFASGSDAVHVSITAANASHVCGKVTLGQGTPPPPPTDPNVGYPPSLVESLKHSSNGAAGVLNMETEGFPLTILNGTSSADRLQFQVNDRELWKAWCEMQTPYRFQLGGPSDTYLCTAYSGWGSGPSGCTGPNGEIIDCAKQQLCSSNVCTCSASGCTVSPTGDVNFDLHVQSADKLSGSTTLMDLHNVYLNRTP